MVKRLNKRTVLIILFSVFIVCIAGILVYCYLENLAEERLKDYIMRLEKDGFTIEECHLADFNVEGVVQIHFFGDFKDFAQRENVEYIYLDRKIKALFFLHPINNRVEAVVFYYA